MIEAATIARPYAEAIFRLAQEQNKMDVWSDLIERMTSVASFADVRPWLDDIRLTREQVADLFASLCGVVDKEGRALIKLLADNRRLTLLPHIRTLFVTLKDRYSGVRQVKVQSAYPLDATQRERFTAELKKSLGTKVNLTEEAAPQLLAGACIRVGDLVIEDTAHSRLEALAWALKH